MESRTAIKHICSWNKETFVISDKGIIAHLLPGEETLYYPESGCKLASFTRKQKTRLPAGAGSITDHSGKTWGGFVTIFCSLVSPRRFVLSHTAELFQSESVEDILSADMRRTLMNIMERAVNCPEWNGTDADKQQLWSDIEKNVQEALRKTGWEADSVKPGTFSCTEKEV